MPVRPRLPRPPAPEALRRRVSGRSERLTTTRSVRASIVSLAGVVGGPVCNQAGEEVGRLIDIVARVHGDERYPPVTGLVVRVGRRRLFLDASAIGRITHREVRLRTARLDLRDFVRRPGEVLLARDLMDHQLVDVDGVQVIRAADLYLAPVANRFRLVGVDVSLTSLLRRLGPKRFRGRPTPDRVIDWDAVAPFGEELTVGPATVRLRSSHDGLRRLRPGELADLLEDLGRPGRQGLLASLDPATAADALEEMEPDELEALLRETPAQRAAGLITAMEPDEAVDALRDLSPDERAEMLAAMPAEMARQLSRLLTFREDRAGGFMTTTLARAGAEDSVGAVRAGLVGLTEHRNEIEAVAVVDPADRLVADVALFDLLVQPADRTVGGVLEALGYPEPLTVGPNATVAEVAAQLIESRRSSLLVVDDQRRPLGRILADDVLDALTPDQGRHHFPRLLQ